MNAEQEAAVAQAIAGIESALTWLEADVRRLQRALDAGISLEVICELNRILWRAPR